MIVDRPFVVLCTGFHRSGTSLTAKRLLAAGFGLGDHLLPANPSNREGHFEDSAAVELHDRWLHRHGTDWLFADQTPLPPDDDLASDITGYVAQRDAGGRPWAVKDPRASLALPDWDRALGARGRYILVIRHWSECAQSLLQRHSRELAHHVPAVSVTHPHFRFWSDPGIALRAWLSYSTRLLAFAAAQPERAVIVSTRAIAAQERLADIVSDRLGVALPETAPDHAFRPELLSSRVRSAMLPAPPRWLRRRLDAVWRDLLDLAEFKASDETITRDRSRLPAWGRAAIDDAVDLRLDAEVTSLPPTPAAERSHDLDPYLLEALPSTHLTHWTLAAARRSLSRRDFDEAERLLLAGLERTDVPHPLWLLLGDVEMARGRLHEALDGIERCIALRPSRHASSKRVRCLAAMGRWADALEPLDALLADDPADIDMQLLRAQAIERLHGPAQALASLSQAPGNDRIELQRIQLEFSLEPEQASSRLRALLRRRLQSADLVDGRARAQRATDRPAAWTSLLETVVPHWLALLGAQETWSRLGARMPPPAAAPSLVVAGPDAVARDLAACLESQDWLGMHSHQDASVQWSATARRYRHRQPVEFRNGFCDLLESASAALAVAPAPPSGWFWRDDAAIWHADQLMSLSPDLRMIYAFGDPELSRHGLAAQALVRACPAVPRTGADTTSPYWCFKAWVAALSEALALQSRWPGRILVVGAGTGVDGIGGDPRLAAFLAGAPVPDWSGSVHGVHDATGLDPADLQRLVESPGG